MAATHKKILGQGSRLGAAILGLTAIVTLFSIWWLVSASGVIAPRFLPTPGRVFESAVDIRPNIFVQLGYTTFLVLVAFSLGSISAIYVGVLMRSSFVARSILSPLVESWRPVPAVAVIPFFIIWFGFAWYGKLLLVAFASFLVVVVGVVEAIDKINPVYLRAALSFGANNKRLADLVLVPGMFPGLLAPLRIALATAITVAVVAEFMGATIGIGHVLNVAMNTFSTHTVVLCGILLGLIGACLDWLLRLCHRRFVSWAKTADEAVQYTLPSE